MQNNIQPFHEVFYLESIFSITSKIIFEHNEIEKLLKNKNDYDLKYLESSLIIVKECANISKFFWPSKDKPIHLNRATILKRVFFINNENPLNTKEVRNFIEHFDEKLDIYLKNYNNREIYPNYVGFENNIAPNNYTFFRAFYIDTMTFEILDRKIKILPLINEVKRIHYNINLMIENGGRFT